MRRALAGVLVAFVLVGAGVAVAQMPMDHGGGDTGAMVGMTASAFTPRQIDVLAGDTVMWHNGAVRAHTVTADDGTWTSDRLGIGSDFSHRFDAAGMVTYHCQIHAGMLGEVDVHDLLLDAPEQAAGKDQPFPLSGRAALPEGSQVTIEADSGQGFEKAGSATIGQDGSFRAMLTPHTSATYRAVSGERQSPAVQLIVLDRAIRVSGRRHGRTSVIRVHVTPRAAGSLVVLQLRLKERFGWWPQHVARLDAHSNARFVVKLRRRVAARAALVLRDGATVIARSRIVRAGPPRR